MASDRKTELMRSFLETIATAPGNCFTQDGDGDTFVHILICSDCSDEEIAHLLVPLSAEHDWNIVNNDGQTVLLLAVVTGKPLTATVLLQKGADIRVRYKNEDTIIHVACENSKLQCLGVLLSANKTGRKNQCLLSMETRNSLGKTPLHVSVHENEIDQVKLLLQEGSNVNSQELHNKKTCLQTAVERKSLEMVRVLLDHGASYDMQMTDGTTALHYAIGHAHTDISDELMARGASTSIRSKQNVSPLSCSPDAKRKEELTRKHYASKTRKRRQKQNPWRSTSESEAGTSLLSHNVTTRQTSLPPASTAAAPGPTAANLPIAEAMDSLNSLLATTALQSEDMRSTVAMSRDYNQQLAQDLLTMIAMKPTNETERQQRHVLLDQYYEII